MPGSDSEEGFEQMEGGDKDEALKIEKAKLQAKNAAITQSTQRPVGFSERPAPQGQLVAQFPDKEWFAEWKGNLNLPNIKACVNHTYSKAMHIRNEMVQKDSTLSTQQVFNIDEDLLMIRL
jgi:hypothetical protein